MGASDGDQAKGKVAHRVDYGQDYFEHLSNSQVAPLAIPNIDPLLSVFVIKHTAPLLEGYAVLLFVGSVLVIVPFKLAHEQQLCEVFSRWSRTTVIEL